ncbi:hypothetical protein A2773_00565 [Candidatus Gottesmanbacteria bacterium RIFCSPHIGHO2_01_FULL_39_10]|uniref:tRNA/rRNA methyltransferase SpoU type domain-containing protein n=1 Tax=Candidatus Gottesmanbacteria bacterium RIFCSPHIGHO2_01_FULL_39_10 TaxID=1798375 RepID=A0A1F5ZM10_9BACT|nr:MAG: hypothetical protein A2773_00565 [Candidatus Gottesmanbacteria bacterium RIFCSPHIGHO2_01_FULL_39_10]
MKQLRGKYAKKFIKNLPKRDKSVVLILENVQYATNVANIFRTAESAGVEKIYLTGVSKTPPFGKDLKKVSRGAERKVTHESIMSALNVIPTLKNDGYVILAIELVEGAIMLEELKDFLKHHQKICFIAGSEDSGVNRTSLELCDGAVTIPMYGKNPSLNVTVSVGIVLFSF